MDGTLLRGTERGAPPRCLMWGGVPQMARVDGGTKKYSGTPRPPPPPEGVPPPSTPLVTMSEGDL